MYKPFFTQFTKQNSFKNLPSPSKAKGGSEGLGKKKKEKNEWWIKKDEWINDARQNLILKSSTNFPATKWKQISQKKRNYLQVGKNLHPDFMIGINIMFNIDVTF